MHMVFYPLNLLPSLGKLMVYSLLALCLLSSIGLMQKVSLSDYHWQCLDNYYSCISVFIILSVKHQYPITILLKSHGSTTSYIHT